MTINQLRQIGIPMVLVSIGMITFGFPAFLKILSLNEKPQRTEIRRRLAPSDSAYDFHKRMRSLARQFLIGNEPLARMIELAENISQVAERKSALAALERLDVWKASTPGEFIEFAPATFESQRALFRIKFEPVFALLTKKRIIPFQIWNTLRPRLALGPTYGALTLARQAYQTHDRLPDDLAVLSLQPPFLTYMLSTVSDQTALAASLVSRVEDVIQGPAAPESHPESRVSP